MTTQRMRTPRRRKIWANKFTAAAIAASTAPVRSEITSNLETDIGAKPVGTTLVRILGHVRLVENSTASTPAHGQVHFGVAWLMEHATTDIPDPSVSGSRETAWVVTGRVEGKEVSSSLIAGQGAMARPEDANRVIFDSRMMRKQPGAEWGLYFVYAPGSTFEASTMALEWDLQALLALP